MNLLLANDDGVIAPGIRALYLELKQNFNPIIVAPLEERSTTGHSLSLDKPLRLEQLESNIFGCSGFPADCVLMGLHVLQNSRPDIVISGINRGANLGQDLYYSGTIAAAREAAFHGLPSIAVSLALKNLNGHHFYETAAKIVSMCLELKLHQNIPKLALININVPNLDFSEIKGFKLTKIGFRRYSEEVHARIDTRERNYYWIAGQYLGFNGEPDSDCQVVEDGFVSITPHYLVDNLEEASTGLSLVIERLNAKMAP
jgi:5'-nucleotidase